MGEVVEVRANLEAREYACPDCERLAARVREALSAIAAELMEMRGREQTVRDLFDLADKAAQW